VKHDNEEGIIYFRDGNIIHAEKGDLFGEDAFNYIMSWKGGEFSVRKNVSIPKATIFSSWQSLILESMRRADEDSPLAKDDEDQEKYWRFRKLELLLKPIKNSEGVLHIIVHSRMGIPIYYVGKFNNEQEEITGLANEISSFLRGFEKGKIILNNQPVEFLEIQFEEQTIFIYKIPYQDSFLSIVGNKRLNAGFVRFEVKKTLYQIAQLI
jgi:predicted regulator of Ras-like GTPase activity (Roadblock/LC7/MglB family)